MLKPKDEIRPKCKWNEHDWQLDHYGVLESEEDDYSSAVEVLKCSRCGRIRCRALQED